MKGLRRLAKTLLFLVRYPRDAFEAVHGEAVFQGAIEKDAVEVARAARRTLNETGALVVQVKRVSRHFRSGERLSPTPGTLDPMPNQTISSQRSCQSSNVSTIQSGNSRHESRPGTSTPCFGNMGQLCEDSDQEQDRGSSSSG